MALKILIKEFSAFLGNNESILDKDYKHVAEKIELHWGYDEFYSFINKLIINDKDRHRNGFSVEVMQELHELSEIHDRLFPEKKLLAENMSIQTLLSR